MKPPDVYLHGMTVLSTIHRLAGPYPEADGYQEIAESFLCPGGETMNAAMLLAGLGLAVKIGGPHWGRDTRAVLARYAAQHGIDTSDIVIDESFPGVRDLVLVDDRHRTVFGWFNGYFSDGARRWGEPNRAAIRAAKVVAIDPFFSETSEAVARICVEENRGYVTIDCRHDGPLHGGSAATVISREYRRQEYPQVDDAGLLQSYLERARGLVIFTSGREPIRFARRGTPVSSFPPFVVEVTSTLGAGDTFRAGVVYGLWRGWADADTVRFAAALAGVMCTRLPIADHVASLAEVEAFMSRA